MDITQLVVHHSASARATTFEAIEYWHTAHKTEGGRGWREIGYHWVILADGTRRFGRPMTRAGAHCPPNAGRLGVCIVGDNTDDIGLHHPANSAFLDEGQGWTSDQIMNLVDLVKDVRTLMPWVTVHRHSEFRATKCPGLSDQSWNRIRRLWGDS